MHHFKRNRLLLKADKHLENVTLGVGIVWIPRCSKGNQNLPDQPPRPSTSRVFCWPHSNRTPRKPGIMVVKGLMEERDPSCRTAVPGVISTS